MFSPPDYIHYLLLYVAMYQETIGIVLVQEDDDLQEHIVYYLRWNLIDVELRYSHVEKLSLANVHAIQGLRHYILLRQTIVVAHINQFYFGLNK